MENSKAISATKGLDLLGKGSIGYLIADLVMSVGSYYDIGLFADEKFSSSLYGLLILGSAGLLKVITDYIKPRNASTTN